MKRKVMNAMFDYNVRTSGNGLMRGNGSTQKSN